MYLLPLNECNTFIQWQYANLSKLILFILHNKTFINATQYYVATQLT